jgi:hypothetical protein
VPLARALHPVTHWVSFVDHNPVKYNDPSGHMVDEGDGGGCTDKIDCSVKKVKINKPATKTPTPTINPICNGGPTNGCATATAFKATESAKACKTGFSCIVAPTPTFTPAPTPTLIGQNQVDNIINIGAEVAEYCFGRPGPGPSCTTDFAIPLVQVGGPSVAPLLIPFIALDPGVATAHLLSDIPKPSTQGIVTGIGYTGAVIPIAGIPTILALLMFFP